MAEQINWAQLGQSMKEKGLTCPALKSMIDEQVKNSKQFRELNMTNLAKSMEDAENKLKNVYGVVCALN